MDTVLVDAPCSCSGTLRRRPDQKWNLTEDFLKEIITVQRDILIQSIKYVKEGGILIYATCSILQEENEEQVEFLKKIRNLSLLEKRSIPLLSMGSDAMYVAIFKKKFSCVE